MKPGVPASFFLRMTIQMLQLRTHLKIGNADSAVNRGLKGDGVLDYFDDHEQPSQKRGEKAESDT